MTFTVLPGQTQLGELLLKIMELMPYEGPQMPLLDPQPEVRISLLGIAQSDGTLVLNAQNPMAVWAAANDRWERQCLSAMIECLEKKSGHLTLVSDNLSLPNRTISINALWHIPVSRVKYSIFSAMDYHLEAFREYEGASIYIETAVADAALSTAQQLTGNQPTKGGRPRKVELAAAAYAALFPNGHAGCTWKQVATSIRRERGLAVGIDTLRRALKQTKP